MNEWRIAVWLCACRLANLYNSNSEGYIRAWVAQREHANELGGPLNYFAWTDHESLVRAAERFMEGNPIIYSKS